MAQKKAIADLKVQLEEQAHKIDALNKELRGAYEKLKSSEESFHKKMDEKVSEALNFNKQSSATASTSATLSASSVTTTPKIKYPEPHTYSGLSHEDASQYLRDMEAYHAFKGLTDDRLIAMSFGARLGGEAKNWFQRQPAEVNESYSTLKDLFSKRYIKVDFEQSFADLASLKLKTNHDWDMLIAKHAQICDRLGFDQEKQRIATFITCLPSETAALVRCFDFEDVRECAAKAKSLNQSLPKRGIQVNALGFRTQGSV